MSSSRSSHRHQAKIKILAILGVLLLAASIAVRFADRPSVVQTISPDDPDEYNQFFGIGVAKGGFENLKCGGICPPALLLRYRDSDPTRLDGVLQGALDGTQGGSEPARIVLAVPAGTTNFGLADGTDPGITLSTDVVTVGPTPDVPAHGEKVTVVTLSVSAIEDDGYFGLEFDWNPGHAVTPSGIGRRNLRVALDENHPALQNLDIDSMYAGGLDTSLMEVNLQVRVFGYRIGGLEPDPTSRPYPDLVGWRAQTNQLESYYVVSVENGRLRFWIDLVNEQTLFISGLLLGAVIGAIASEWFTSSKVVDGDVSGRSFRSGTR